VHSPWIYEYVGGGSAIRPAKVAFHLFAAFETAIQADLPGKVSVDFVAEPVIAPLARQRDFLISGALWNDVFFGKHTTFSGVPPKLPQT